MGKLQRSTVAVPELRANLSVAKAIALHQNSDPNDGKSEDPKVNAHHTYPVASFVAPTQTSRYGEYGQSDSKLELSI